ncbi:hypothetical protein CHH28_08885 [Bacterioplanes sanyensis]|uniref:Lipoprotein n=1 Tax=Bacterioplanes sanyensis TaxID=1249553 RepID=A0A222FIH3_9GAMM|nr:hypothetical protein [Bacterioplanes sanyensis]ASP38788.1 hypothetical protein CHH28_08885 [Bacterioplanes sanyensis]
MKVVIFTFWVIIIAGCSDTTENLSVKVGGNIIKISGDDYKIVTLLDKTSEPKSVDAKLIKSVESPIEMIKLPMSIQKSWRFETKECGYLDFYEALTGEVLCMQCDANSYSYKECPLEFMAIDTLRFNVQD